jgi:hypothetical protein
MAQASICREKARSDPVHDDYWIDEAVAWLQRATGAGDKNIVTHGIDDGRMIPKRVHASCTLFCEFWWAHKGSNLGPLSGSYRRPHGLISGL